MTNEQQQQDAEKAACGKSPSTAGLGAWLPIETIPIDGMRVLVTDGLDVIIGWWGEGSRGYGRSYRFDFHVRGDNLGHDGADDELIGATHWMPLPEAPNVKITGG